MYHHYKGENLSRSEKIQRLAVERIINSTIPDEQRENSKVWELKHCNSCIQIGRLLAIKRGLDIELAEIICALHDVYVIDIGKYSQHAEKGAEIAKKILEDTKSFTQEELKTICRAIKNHSDKQIYSDDPYSELIKDTDIFDCSLYEGVKDYYEEHKPPDVRKEYYKRINSVRKELSLPLDEQFLL